MEGVRTNLNESHEMRRNREKFSQDLKALKIPRDDEIPRNFSPINANAATISQNQMTEKDKSELSEICRR